MKPEAGESSGAKDNPAPVTEASGTDCSKPGIHASAGSSKTNFAGGSKPVATLQINGQVYDLDNMESVPR